MATAVINARVEENLLEQFKTVVDAAGITVSEAIRRLMEQAVRTGSFAQGSDAADEHGRIDEISDAIEQLSLSVTAERLEGWGRVDLDKELLGAGRTEKYA